MADCETCDASATVEIQFPEVSETWHPYCSGCHEQMSADAAEVNNHELARFGGAFGLVEWNVRHAASPPPDPDTQRGGR